jgi:hypothetical protein
VTVRRRLTRMNADESWRRPSLIVILLIVGGIHRAANACSMSYIPTPVTQKFQIVLTDGERAIRGMRVTIEDNPSDSIVMEAFSDANGRVDVGPVPDGSYVVSAGEGTAVTVFALVCVGRGCDTGQRRPISVLPLSWPDKEFMAIKNARGVLHAAIPSAHGNRVLSIAFPDYGPLAERSLQLKALDGSTVAEATTDSYGRFDFSAVPQGRYLLEVTGRQRGGRQIEDYTGEIWVELKEQATSDELSLFLQWNSCGLSYSPLCVAEPINTSGEVCGVLTDTEGASIGGAKLLLLHSGFGEKREMPSVFTDQLGRFDLALSGNGEYYLTVQAVGFAPSRLPLRVSTTQQKCTTMRVAVPLSGMGCTVHVELPDQQPEH